MSVTDIKTCYIGPEISPEQFIAEHFFLYIAKGAIHGYDGNKSYTLGAGEYCLIRKNRLARYNKERINGEFEKVIVIFDEVFLKKFQEKYAMSAVKFHSTESFVKIRKTASIPDFLCSLMPYRTNTGRIEKAFAESKHEEFLLLLLRNQPELAGVFFDYGIPGKLNLEEYMNRNYKFNVTLQRFAYLTGRSLSAFKRDFKTIFQETPTHWLVEKRLREAYVLIEKKNKRPSDIYLDLGFEDLSHFSFAFKKLFGLTPTELAERNKIASR